MMRTSLCLFPKAYSLGYDYINGDSDPFPPYSGLIPERQSHGTQVAGVITAARDNGVCGVGGAYDATLTGIYFYTQVYTVHKHIDIDMFLSNNL